MSPPSCILFSIRSMSIAALPRTQTLADLCRRKQNAESGGGVATTLPPPGRACTRFGDRTNVHLIKSALTRSGEHWSCHSIPCPVRREVGARREPGDRLCVAVRGEEAFREGVSPLGVQHLTCRWIRFLGKRVGVLIVASNLSGRPLTSVQH